MSEPGERSADERLHVFISYSRRDLTFARALRDRLIAEEFDAFIDVEDIVKGEPWRERLGPLIASADAVLFLISPDSVASEICGWEVNEAERLGKRVLPVLARETAAETIPGRLSRLNYTFLDDPGKDSAEFGKLLVALREDADWVREHTRLGELAARWIAAGRPSRLLLRGADLSAAEQWRDAKPPAAPEPTSLHLDFILASRRGASRRLRWWIGGASGVAAGAAALAVLALFQSIEAAAQRDAALLTQSRFLADLAQQACDSKDSARCLALALEAAPKPELGDDRPYAPAVEAAMLRGLLELREKRVLFAENAPIRDLALDPGGAWLASLARTSHQTGRKAVFADGEQAGVVRIRDMKSGKVLRTLSSGGDDPDALSFDADPATGRLAVGDRDGSVRVFDPQTGVKVAKISAFSNPILRTRYSPQGRYLAVTAGPQAAIFETRTWRKVAEINHHVAGLRAIAFSRDEAHFVVAESGDRLTLWRMDPSVLTTEGSNSPQSATGAVVVARKRGSEGWSHAALIGDGRRQGLLFNLAGDAPLSLEAGRRWEGEGDDATGLAFNHDRTRMAAVLASGAVHI